MSIREAPILVVAGWLARHVLGFCALVLLFSGFARPAWAQSSRTHSVNFQIILS